MLVLIINFFSLHFRSIEIQIEGERVSSSQNERAFGGGVARKRARAKRGGGGGRWSKLGNLERTYFLNVPMSWFLINFIVSESFFLCVSNTDVVSCWLKTRQSIKDTWLGTLMWLDFVARTVCWIIGVYHVNLHWVYFLENCALSNRKSFPSVWGGGVVAISDVLLKEGLTFKTYLDKGEGE